MPKPPRQSEVLAASVVNSITQALADLLDLWNDLGITKEKQLERMETVKAHIEKLLEDMIEEERNLKEKIENDIVMQKMQLNIIRKELNLDSYQVEEGLSILQLERKFRLALEAAVKEKRERLEKLRRLQQEDQALCAELCATPYYIPTGHVPTSLELKELEEHVQSLLQVKEQRLEEFLRLRREIRQYNKEIGHLPEGTLEDEMLLDDDDYICLTKKNIEDLKSLVYQLQIKKDSLTATLETLKKEVQLLWGRLQWSQEQQEEHKRITSKLSISEALRMWEELLQNLEVQKKEQLKDLTLKVRQQLDSYWQKCFYSDEQRAAFQPFFSDNFTEDLLSQHDQELLKMKSMFEDNKLMYNGVHQWASTWDRFIELEKKSTDPSRLLNRGGTLLKDERERSKLQRQLLKLSEDLKKSIENWEKENGCDFLVNSKRFSETIDHQLEHHKVKKDHPKMFMNKDKSAGPKSAVKRAASPSASPAYKFRKVNGGTNLSVLKPSNSCNLALPNTPGGKQPAQIRPADSLGNYDLGRGTATKRLLKETPSKSIPLDSQHRPPLEECEESTPDSELSYSYFTKDLSVKSSGGRIFNSTFKESPNW